MISLGASCVRCPQCSGDGLLERTVGGGGWPEEDVMVVCNVCAPEGRASMFSDRGPGWLELPLDPLVAERIYSNGNVGCMELVGDDPVVPIATDDSLDRTSEIVLAPTMTPVYCDVCKRYQAACVCPTPRTVLR